MSAIRWSKWQLLPGWTPGAAVLAETLDGGQSFRWTRDDKETWSGTWAGTLVQVKLADGQIAWRTAAGTEAKTRRAMLDYFGEARVWTAREDALPWRSDGHLRRCVEAYRGLRILRQPFGETLLCFLCSATKQIVQIKQMVALLAERHGAAIVDANDAAADRPSSAPFVLPPRSAPNRLPTWNELARVPETELRACLLGFRARYIAATAQFLAARPAWLEETEALPYAAAKARLLELPGVGEKVADCVLLFGAGKLEAFPVDTWILKALQRRYGLTGWHPAQVAQFGRAHFGPLAGYAQQFLFAWERAHGRNVS